jgi:hypothetical protein
MDFTKSEAPKELGKKITSWIITYFALTLLKFKKWHWGFILGVFKWL